MAALAHTYGWSALATCPPSRRHERVGSITADFTRLPDTSGESTLGNLVADAMLWTAKDVPGAHPDFAVTPVLGWTDEGNLESDLRSASGAGRPGMVTLGGAWGAGGFGVTLAVDTVPTARLLQMFNSMWRQGDGSSDEIYRPLSVSRNVRLAWDARAPLGERIQADDVTIDGMPLDPGRSYRVVSNALLLAGAQGYDGPQRTAEVIRLVSMHEAFMTYVRRHPGLSPEPLVRMRVR